MPDDKLVNYFKENMKNGYSAEQLKETLLKSGFDPKEIDEALSFVQNADAAPTQDEGKDTKPKPAPVPIQEKYPHLFQPVKTKIKPRIPIELCGIAMMLIGVLSLVFGTKSITTSHRSLRSL